MRFDPEQEHAALVEERKRRADIRDVAERGLRAFVKAAWHLVEPSRMLSSWHVDALCDHLEACQRREIRRLIINIPPGCQKSLTVSVFYPAWCWINDPQERFLFVSYAADVASRDATRMRNVVGSEWFYDRWGREMSRRKKKPSDPPNFLTGTNQIKMFENAKGGFRMSAQMGGQVTGKHAHQTWIDDALKPADAIGGSEVTRVKMAAAREFWRGTLYNRQAEPTRHVHGVIMQRLHDLDLAGVLLDEGGYEHLMLPMRFEAKRRCVTALGVVDKRTEEGELLWPERFPEAVTADLEAQLHQHASAQMQQNPVPATGGIFKREWLAKFWSLAGPNYVPGTIPLPDLKKMQLCQSWDMTFKKSADADRVAGGVWGRHVAQYFLLDEVCRRMSYTETKQAMRDMRDKWPRARACLVEDKANGSAILDEMSKELSGLIAVDPEGGKEARAWAVSPLFQAGNVILPHPRMTGYGWVNAYIEELARFPKAPHDDEVDETTQALNHLSLHAPKWVGAMTEALQRDKAREAPAQTPEPAPVAEPAPVDVAALRARLGR